MKKRCAALCAAALLHVVPAIAQEMNYTPFQLGARSALMGGAAVGGVRDSSATFYNPGALGFVTDRGRGRVVRTGNRRGKPGLRG